jgi:hypothetical protein
MEADLRKGNRVFTRRRSLNLQDCSGEDVSRTASELLNVIDLSTRSALCDRENRGQEQEANDGNISMEKPHHIPL